MMNERNQPCKSKPEICRMCFVVAIILEAIDSPSLFLSLLKIKNK